MRDTVFPPRFMMHRTPSVFRQADLTRAINAVAAGAEVEVAVAYTLRQALTRNSDGSGSGPLACALDLIAEWR
jgi:hypothetical protein